MRRLRPSGEAEMVALFLCTELPAARSRDDLRALLERDGLPEPVVTRPDLDDDAGPDAAGCGARASAAERPAAPGPAATAPVTQITESGFLRARGDQFRTIADPQAEGVVTINGLAYSGTAASGVNNLGQIVGSYAAGGTSHGFLLDDAVHRTIDVPSARSTTVADINNRGELVGSYTGRDGRGHGFERSRSGRITTIDVPGAFSTDPHRINDPGQLVGVYSD